MIKNINIKNMIKFTLPIIFTMIFMSFYSMVDGIFVSNLIGENALSAINVVFPIISIILAFGLMLGTGGNAIIAKLLGEHKKEEANSNFTNFTIVGLILGIISSLLIYINIDWFLKLLNANPAIYTYCYEYLKYLLLFFPFLITQIIFQTALVTANKPQISFISMFLGGITNIILNYILMVPFNLGIKGAAIATGIGYTIPVIVGLSIFTKKKNIIHFNKPKINIKDTIHACLNGSSEMVGNIATAITTLLFNISIFKIVGNNGIAAVTVILYAHMFLNAIFTGYSMGISPIFSFNYGDKNYKKLKTLFSNSIKIILTFSILATIIAITFANPITTIFIEESSNVYNLTIEGFKLFSVSFLFAGYNIFTSSLFTAYGNGKISALLSFSRTFIFITISLLVLPKLIGVYGIWLSIPIAEFITLFLSITLIKKYEDYYIEGIEPVITNPYHIITIENEFAAGGREIGKKLADKLGYNYFDEETINNMIKDNINEENIKNIKPKPFNNSYSLTLAKTLTNYRLNSNHELQVKESLLIKKLAKENNCIFVGKCATYILEQFNPLSIYVYSSNIEDKINRVLLENKTIKDRNKIKDKIKQIEKQKVKYYETTTDDERNDILNYNLSIDTSKLDIKKSIEFIYDNVK